MEKQSEGSRFQVTDRRFWVEDDSLVDQAKVPERRYPTYIEELETRTRLAEEKLKEKLAQIDEDNKAFRARQAREMEKRLEQEKLELIRNFLEVIDNFERALESAEQTQNLGSLKEGVELNLKLLTDRIKSLGVEGIEVLNQPFDPNIAEAIGTMEVDSSEEDQIVKEVVQRGYRFKDQLLRPARVRVGRYDPEPST